MKNDTIQKITHTLKYNSTTTFITIFKKNLKQTPNRYITKLTTISPQSTKPNPQQ